jgi:hypothetical protein
MGRLLGPQLMTAGGGKATSDWFGMYYAGQSGKRLPVPIFQALECGAVFVIALLVERLIRQRQGPVGVICATVVALWSLSRFFDEYLWLGPDNGTDAVEVTALILTGLGLLTVAIPLSTTPPFRSPEVRWLAPVRAKHQLGAARRSLCFISE